MYAPDYQYKQSQSAEEHDVSRRLRHRKNQSNGSIQSCGKSARGATRRNLVDLSVIVFRYEKIAARIEGQALRIRYCVEIAFSAAWRKLENGVAAPIGLIQIAAR